MARLLSSPREKNIQLHIAILRVAFSDRDTLVLVRKANRSAAVKIHIEWKDDFAGIFQEKFILTVAPYALFEGLPARPVGCFTLFARLVRTQEHPSNAYMECCFRSHSRGR